MGAHVIRTDPAAAEQSLDVIADTSRRALEQTRSMLGMLREESEDGTRPPTQGLDDLPALVADVRAAGLEVELVRSGSARRARRGGLAGGVPDRAGVAHQRHQALRRRRRHGHGARSPSAPSRSRSAIPDPPARRRAPARRATGWSGSTSASAWSAASLDVRRRTATGSASTRPCPVRAAPDDQGRGRRRPGPGARRVRAAAGLRRRRRGRGGGARRAGGDRPVPAHGAGRRADGRPDAAPRRPGGDPHDPGRPGLPRTRGSWC